uniref:Uncharacterized protein n=1 Tax=Romanomermis culicivorax TaxID=13658 RepID=A0A915HF00_ROMCU
MTSLNAAIPFEQYYLSLALLVEMGADVGRRNYSWRILFLTDVEYICKKLNLLAALMASFIDQLPY